MFTGIIQKVGQLAGLEGGGDGWRLVVAHAAWDTPLEKGESVAVQGVCLTVTDSDTGQFSCDILDETLDRCNLKSSRPGELLNLERALRASDRMGGHMVSGHVDGMGRVTSRCQAGRDWVLEIACPDGLMSGIVGKGSVACDGVSLTVSAVSERAFSVHLIPATWQGTSLHARSVGAAVNIETDMMGKYVRHELRGMGRGAPIDVEGLRRAGFV